MNLHDLVRQAAQRAPSSVAVREPGRTTTYGELDALAARYAGALAGLGVRAGDRVLLWAEKSADVVALMQAALRLGASYVPVTPGNPAARVARVAAGCTPRLVVTDLDRAGELDWPCATLAELRSHETAAPPWYHADPDELAYVLYTSGSTGEPKGVCVSHENALAFVRWAAHETGLSEVDRLTNHAPFNFDLSVFDLYAAFLTGASVYLVPSELAYAPEELLEVLDTERITVWYSVPSVLQLMLHHADLAARPVPVALRVCVFAGEPFPLMDVTALRRAWPDVRMFNWYGPTETNVCTSYEVTARDLDRTTALPIGFACSGDQIDLDPPGEEGEIVVTGPTVMLGYWGRAPHTGPYRTGDIGRLGPGGVLEFVGRRDHLVKLRGHRVELGEVETALAGHDRVRAAVVFVTGSGPRARLHAVVVPAPGPSPTLLGLKAHCAGLLPTYMLPDRLHVVAELPRTPNGKVDRATLTRTLTTQESHHV